MKTTLKMKVSVQELWTRAQNQTKNKYTLCKERFGDYFDTVLHRWLEDIKHDFKGWSNAIHEDLINNHVYVIPYHKIIYTIYQSAFRNYCKLIIEKDVKTLGFKFEHQGLVIERLLMDIKYLIDREAKRKKSARGLYNKEYERTRAKVRKQAKTTARRINRENKGLYNKSELKIIEAYIAGMNTYTICKAFDITKGSLYRLLQRDKRVFELLNIVKWGTKKHEIRDNKHLFNKRVERVSAAYGVCQVYYNFRQINQYALDVLKNIMHVKGCYVWRVLGTKVKALINHLQQEYNWESHKRSKNKTNKKHLNRGFVDEETILKGTEFWNNVVKEICIQFGLVGLLNEQV